MDSTWRYWDYLKFFKLLNENNHSGVSLHFLSFHMGKSEGEILETIEETNRILNDNRIETGNFGGGTTTYYVDKAINEKQIKEIVKMEKAVGKIKKLATVAKMLQALKNAGQPLTICGMMDGGDVPRSGDVYTVIRKVLTESPVKDYFRCYKDTGKGKKELVELLDKDIEISELLSLLSPDFVPVVEKEPRKYKKRTEMPGVVELLGKQEKLEFELFNITIEARISIDPQARELVSFLKNREITISK